jgi:hypothetical protein
MELFFDFLCDLHFSTMGILPIGENARLSASSLFWSVYRRVVVYPDFFY